jgi:uncharacterized protein YbbC (DUF1343 family)
MIKLFILFSFFYTSVPESKINIESLQYPQVNSGLYTIHLLNRIKMTIKSGVNTSGLLLVKSKLFKDVDNNIDIFHSIEDAFVDEFSQVFQYDIRLKYHINKKLSIFIKEQRIKQPSIQKTNDMITTGFSIKF